MNLSIQRRKCSPRRNWYLSFALPVFLLVAAWQVPSLSAQEGLDHDLIWRPALSPDGSKAVVMDGKELRVVDVKTGKELQVIKGHEFTIYAVAYSPDGKRILSGDGNCLRLWDAQTGKLLQRIEGRNGNLSSLAMTSDGNFAVSGHSAGSGVEMDPPRDLFLWDLKTGQVVSQDKIVLDRWIAQHLFSGFNELASQESTRTTAVGGSRPANGSDLTRRIPIGRTKGSQLRGHFPRRKESGVRLRRRADSRPGIEERQLSVGLRHDSLKGLPGQSPSRLSDLPIPEVCEPVAHPARLSGVLPVIRAPSGEKRTRSRAYSLTESHTAAEETDDGSHLAKGRS